MLTTAALVGQLAALRELGCEFGQGFYLGSPAIIDPIEVAAECTATR